MSQCPQCHGSISIESSHYGALFTCLSCSAVFFVDYNGNPEKPEAHDYYEPPPQGGGEQSGTETQTYSEIPSGDEYRATSAQNDFSHSEESEYSQSSAPDFNSGSAAGNYQPLEAAGFKPPEAGNYQPLEAAGFQPLDSGEFKSVEDIPPSSEELETAGFSAFGFGEETAKPTTGKKSDIDVNSGEPEVMYDLAIDGLEVKSTWDPIKDVLSEPRLKLDVRALEQKIANGRLVLKKISPLVVFYIVQRIKSYNVKIRWAVHEDK